MGRPEIAEGLILSSQRGRLTRVQPEEPVTAMQPGDDILRAQLLTFAKDLNRIYLKERARSDELRSAVDDLEESYFQMISAFAFLVEARDPNTRSHLHRAHDYAVALAARVDKDLADDKIFRYGFMLHDIGKMGIPDNILMKPGPLTNDEWEVMKTHPLIGGQILKPISYLERAIPIVECHHEKWDGSGYPRGLKGDQIPLAARVFSVVDTFDAMTSDRPYREALTVEQAVEEILAAGGTQLDLDVAREFAGLCSDSAESWPLEAPAADEPVEI